MKTEEDGSRRIKTEDGRRRRRKTEKTEDGEDGRVYSVELQHGAQSSQLTRCTAELLHY